MSDNINKKARLNYRTRQRNYLLTRKKLLIAGSSILVIFSGLFFYLNIGINKKIYAAAAGDYRTIASGAFNSAIIWQKFNGTIWLATATAPTSTDGTITIQATHTVTATLTHTVDQLVVESGGTLTINSGTFTIANGTALDLDLSGTVNLNGTGRVVINAGAFITIQDGGTYNYNGGTQTLTAGWDVKNGGTYVHNVNGINIPVATWGPSSTIKLTGITTSDINGLTQNFGNFIYNSTSQTGIVEFRDNLQAIQGNFTVLSTGTGSIFIQRVSTPTPLNISGNYFQSGGTVYMTKGAAFTCNLSGTFLLTGGTFVMTERYGMPVMNVYGAFTISGGTFNHSTYNASLANEGIGEVNLFNDYFRSGGSHTETATLTGRGEFNFSKTGTQSFIPTGGTITNTVNFTVKNGAILNMANYLITGGGSFTLADGGGLILGSTAGITASGATGNVQVTGSRNFSTAGDYTYLNTIAQNTGNGLPGTVRNLTFDNTSNVTMSGSSSATGIINFVNGKVITGASVLGSGNDLETGIINYTNTKYVVGNLRRSVRATGSYDFPLGTMTNYELANINFTAMTGVNNLLGSFVNANPIEASYPIAGLTANGTVIADLLNYGYWALTPDVPMTGGRYAVTLNKKGHTNPSSNPLEYCVLKRDNSSSYWQSTGTHRNDTQSETGGIATAARSDLTSFSHFAIGMGNGPLPVTLISFEGKVKNEDVLCTWQTMTEVNNNYFTLQRSADGNEFEEIGRVAGVGYSNNPKSYLYTDSKPLPGTSFYRLKQTDYDGKSKLSQTISVSFTSKNNTSAKLKVAPNPFFTNFLAQFESAESGNTQIALIALNGATVFTQDINYEKGFNSFHLSIPESVNPGVYFLQVKSDELNLPKLKVIKR